MPRRAGIRAGAPVKLRAAGTRAALKSDTVCCTQTHWPWIPAEPDSELKGQSSVFLRRKGRWSLNPAVSWHGTLPRIQTAAAYHSPCAGEAFHTTPVSIPLTLPLHCFSCWKRELPYTRMTSVHDTCPCWIQHIGVAEQHRACLMRIQVMEMRRGHVCASCFQSMLTDSRPLRHLG